MGSVLLDLREAAFTTNEVVINASAVMGEVKVVVDAGTTVIVDGFGVMGEFKEARAKVPFDADQGGPVVRVRGMALMGSVHVQRKAPAGGRRPWPAPRVRKITSRRRARKFPAENSAAAWFVGYVARDGRRLPGEYTRLRRRPPPVVLFRQ
jgi:hypothetical protein